MMTRTVPSYMPNYQMPTVGPAPPSPSPSPPVKRRRVKRRSKPFLHGHRGVALLVLAMIAIMIGVIVGIVILTGKNVSLNMINVIKTGAFVLFCSPSRIPLCKLNFWGSRNILPHWGVTVASARTSCCVQIHIQMIHLTYSWMSLC